MERRRTHGLTALLCTALIGALPSTALADEDSEGVDLCLMVTDCLSQPMDQALVEVQIFRPGSGIIDSDNGYTDDGAICFRFADLECDDEARVSLTPATSDAPDADHIYIYIGDCADAPRNWEIGADPQLCPDAWWSPTRIQAVYYLNN
ncbi:MAG: hypothetical protein FJY75_07995 [Candidatus Eisenbacteria bacterium]|uniref:Uncharacterized protein n=1 Tax=Eiseniibacteriota bacterium TaxID=2212470 RepID=A0A937X8T2_UNCEI|nr:hypothetical protein [Candidatus Eisenbacteria bacterium]